MNIVSEKAKLGDNVRIGNFSTIEDVIIGDNVFIGHNVVVKEGTVIGSGVVIGHNTTIENSAVIGEDTRIQANCYITRYSYIGNKVFMGPSVSTFNEKYISSHGRDMGHLLTGVLVSDGCRIGGGSCLMPGVFLGRETSIGAGSLVIQDTKDFEIWYGHPAVKRGMVPLKERLICITQ